MEGIELYLNGKFIELSDQSKIGITFIANDIGDVQNKRANFTNQFKIPRTGNNIEALGFPNSVNTNSDIPYLKASCRLLQDGVELISNGYAIVNDAAENISVTVYSGNADFFELIKGKKLTDLDFSEYNHTWNLANIIDNIDNNTNEDGYVYGLIAYGENMPSGGKLLTKYLLPAIKCKRILEKIVEATGFNISGSLYEDATSILPKLILPYSRNELQQDLTDLDLQLFDVGLSAASPVVNIPTGDNPQPYYPYGIGGNIPFDDEAFPFFDNGGLHLNGKYVAASSMFQTFVTTVNLDVEVIGPGGYNSIQGYNRITVYIYKKNAANIVQVIGSGYYDDYAITGTLTTYTVTVTSANTIVNDGDIIFVNVAFSQGVTFFDVGGLPMGAGTVNINVGSGCTFNNTIDGNLVYGENLTISSLLPDMLQSDFIKAILNITGSNIQTDAANSTIYISTFQSISESIVIKDWSDKINDQIDLIKFHSSYAQNNYLKYKADASNEVTKGVPNEIGNGLFVILDESLQLEKTIIQLPFAGTVTTPTARKITSGLEVKMPFINKVDPSTYTFSLDTEPRILLYEQENYSPAVRYLGDLTIDPFPSEFTLTKTYTTWFIDSVNDRDFQLGFNNNLIEKYFETLIQMLTNYKEVECEINLTANDLNNYFDHSIPVYISKYQSKFYISSINNYQKGKPTKCNLIRL